MICDICGKEVRDPTFRMPEGRLYGKSMKAHKSCWKKHDGGWKKVKQGKPCNFDGHGWEHGIG